jgi:ribosomal protein S18 acetylase RimI-like enzyme
MITFRPAEEDDYAFLWELHRTVMQPYVAATWGWDEVWQADYFRAHVALSRCQIIQSAGVDVGVLVVEAQSDRVFLELIEILPAYQRAGLGTAVIRQVLTQATTQGLPVALQVLKVNPARRLYERLGFVVIGETATHYLMSTPAGTV